MTAWDYEGYWNVVLGDRDADRVVVEYELIGLERRDLDEWLGLAEAEAWREGGLGSDLPDEWSEHHVRALTELTEATVTMVKNELAT
jgi:hypothetical protein